MKSMVDLILEQEWVQYNKFKGSNVKVFKSWDCKQSNCNFKLSYNVRKKELRFYKVFYRNLLFNPESSAEFKTKLCTLKGAEAYKIYQQL